MNVEERARAAVEAGRDERPTELSYPERLECIIRHVACAMHELLASPLPAPMTPAELAETEEVIVWWARRSSALTGEEKTFADMARRLLDHARALADDVRRMAQDNGYLEGLAEGARRGRAPLLALLRSYEENFRKPSGCQARCAWCGAYWKTPHVPDCALVRALAEGG